MSFSAAALIHMSRLKDRLATNFVPFAEFEHNVANGTLPDFSIIEPNLIMGHSDYHPAVSRALGAGVELPVDPPSSILGGEAFLARIYTAIRSAASGHAWSGWGRRSGSLFRSAAPRRGI